MKISINHNGSDIVLTTGMDPEELLKEFPEICKEFKSRILSKIQGTKEAQVVERIRNYINSKDFTGIESLNAFFNTLYLENSDLKYPVIYYRIKTEVAHIPPLSGELYDRSLKNLSNPLRFSYSDSGYKRPVIMSFHVNWNPCIEVGNGVSEDGYFTIQLATDKRKLK